jgi:hypothetical protein
MSFTYMAGATAVERDYVRSRIRDVTLDSGPLPAGENFSDEELDMIITSEGDSWNRAIAACYEALAAAWAPHVSWTADGMSISQGQTVPAYDKLAERARKRYGGVPGQGSHARSVIRTDGYSQDIAADEVT